MKLSYKTIVMALIAIFSIAAKSNEIEIKDFFSRPALQNVKISPDGKHYAFIVYKEDKNSYYLTVLNRETGDAHGYEYGKDVRINEFHWATNERLLVSVAKVVGFLDNRGGPPTLYGINTDGSKRKVLFARDNYSRITIKHLLPSEPDWILVEKYHFGDTGIGKLHKLNIHNGRTIYLADQPTLSMASDERGYTRTIVNSGGNPRIIFKYSKKITDALNEARLEVYYKRPGQENWLEMSLLPKKSSSSFEPLAVTKDDKFAYFLSDMETKTDALYRLDLSNGSYKKIFESEIVNIESGVYDFDNQLIGVRYEPDFKQIKFIDTDNGVASLLRRMYASFPDSNIYLSSKTDNNQLYVVLVNNDRNPGEYFLFNKKEQSLSSIGKLMPWLDEEELVQMNPILFTARDGVKLRGYLTLPKGQKKNLPLIVNPHGGPHGPRDRWGFNPEVQFLANRGYAVLQVNFRGSGGYGTEFMEKGYGEWGGAMQDDLTDATMWAVKKGIADRERICIYGGSYGGYAALMGVVKEPDLYKCAVGYVGVYDLPTMRKAGDTQQDDFGLKFLDEVLGQNEKTLIDNSPARNVEKIKAKLFIAHGERDIRVPMEQYEVLKESLEQANIPFKSMIRDEGHGYQKIKNRIDFYSAMEKFFEESLNLE